ncbi:MAG: DUF2304 domain-containing protein [Desulfobacterales bacterium]|nr:DUF2304 domain-containing protein [Desulfobacterales bacterium]
MTTYNIATTIIGILIFLIIFKLVRRAILQEKYSLTWSMIGIIAVVLGIFPGIVDWIGKLTGIHYPPVLLMVMAVGALLILNLYLFIFSSQNEVRIKKLLQQVAVLEKLVDELMDKDGPDRRQEPEEDTK